MSYPPPTLYLTDESRSGGNDPLEPIRGFAVMLLVMFLFFIAMLYGGTH